MATSVGKAWRSGVAILVVMLACLVHSAAARQAAAQKTLPEAPAALPATIEPGAAPQGTPRFPLDEGAHPAWKTEWWYVTGWLADSTGRPCGFQVTFFRNRGPADATHASAFAPHQILLAHAAVSDPRVGHIVHEERLARAGFSLAEAQAGRLDIHIDQWQLRRDERGTMTAHIAGRDLALDLTLVATQPPLLEGDHGLSHKGHDPRAFSWYYSEPALQVSGTLRGAEGSTRVVHGQAWLDHEWSNAYVGDGASGWDWTGLNFVDGSALMAFRMRDANGRTLWSNGTWRDRRGTTVALGNGQVDWQAGRSWTSPATGAVYPLEWEVRWPGHQVSLRPLFDDQEMDTRASTGTAYWEGAVTAFESAGGGAGGAAGGTPPAAAPGPTPVPLAHGYLELTGYWKPLHF